MQTRREFMRDVAALAGAATMLGEMPASIRRALAIAPEKGSSFLDAEHVVILMQENRSFDHAFGSLRGVRGFNDPRVIQLADGNPVWVQTDTDGKKYVPFRLDIKETKTTWMGSLPHSWPDQVDAANGGKHDRWLHVKRSGEKEYAALPLTLGYHTRADIPFYYALADAFTICDQHFCSTLTGTTPNRLHLWTGTVRAKPTTESPALVRNEDCDYGQWANWTTFPERLEDHGISWKIYQNELSLPSGLSPEGDAWLANFTDNPIEWFTQFAVRFAASHRAFRDQMVKTLPGEIETLSKQLESQSGEAAAKLRQRLAEFKATLEAYEKDQVDFSAENFDKLAPRLKSLHARAFATNAGDSSYRGLTEITYKDGETTRKVQVPKGDVLYQFRKDVQDGALPTVSWLVPPERFSDHPSSAWYGQWYLSEVLDILTRDPKVWQKTIFILTYDENDGYFDHVPPFQACHPKRPETGRASKGLDTALEYVDMEQDRKQHPKDAVRGNALGLGFRVPLIVASPWSRGGYVCSQVFDHTSVLQFLEKLLTHKTGRKVEETNLTPWRRCVCGDLTSAFQATPDDKAGLGAFLARDSFIETIHKAQFKKVPDGFEPLSAKELNQVRKKPRDSRLPKQEPGARPSCPLPYQLLADGALNKERTRFVIRFEARKDLFGERAAGAPFIAYAFTARGLAVRHYTVAAGESVEDSWPLALFDVGKYHLVVYGPNGFFRDFVGDTKDPAMEVRLQYERANGSEPALTGRVEINVLPSDVGRNLTLLIQDNAYGNELLRSAVTNGKGHRVAIETAKSFGWYDLRVSMADVPGFAISYAGRVETGKPSISDPAMGRGGMSP
jgi:phospholipase C